MTGPMTDIVKYAEGVLSEHKFGNDPLGAIPIIEKLVMALKAERSANDDLVRKLKAATYTPFGGMYSGGSDV